MLFYVLWLAKERVRRTCRSVVCFSLLTALAFALWEGPRFAYSHVPLILLDGFILGPAIWLLYNLARFVIGSPWGEHSNQSRRWVR